MEFLSFFGGVWASIIFGLFVIAMVIGCTFDRHYTESPKWWIFLAALVTLCIWQWDPQRPWFGENSTWSMIWSKHIWSYIGWYLLIGVFYAILEFMLDVRRSARFWSKKWREYKTSSIAHTERLKETALRKRQEAELKVKAKDAAAKNEPNDPDYVPPELVTPTRFARTESREQSLEDLQQQPDFDFDTASEVFNQALVKDFLMRNGMDSHYRYRIVGVEKSADGKGIEPKVNRQQLAENVGVWILFWPFYAISLIIGDLVTEIFRFIADLLVQMSGRFVRNAFKDVFKF